MTVRPADFITDTDVLHDGIEVFWEETKMVGCCRPQVAITNLQKMVQAGIGMVWILENDNRPIGGTACLLSPCPFNGDLIASELFLFVYKADRSFSAFMRLMKTLQHWAAFHQATVLRIGHFGDMDHALTKLYERFGFTPWHTVLHAVL